MDVGRSISFIFEDSDWLKKVAIGGLLLIVPIFGWLVVTGYGLRLTRNVYLGHDQKLPEWDAFGEDFVRGFKAVVAGFVWALPIMFLTIALIVVIAMFSLVDSTGNSALSALIGIFAIVGMIGFNLGVFLVQVAYLLVLPLIWGRLAVTDSLSSAFDIGAIIREIRLVPVPLLIVVLLQLGINSVAGFGIFLCVIGIVFTYFFSYLIFAHLFGQVRRLIAEREAPDTDAGVTFAPSV